MQDLDRRVAVLAQAQHGHFTSGQLDALGAQRRARRHRVDVGRWERVHPGVFRLGGVPLTWESRVMAGCLTVDGSVSSHLTAAHLWGLEGFGPVGIVDVTVPRHARPRRRAGVRYHESLVFELCGATTRFAIPVTGPARTVLDVCASVDDDYRALPALDEVRRRSLASWDELWECLILHACRGRNGIARFRRILDRRWGRSVPHNQFARLAERLFEDAGLPEPVHEHEVIVGGHRYRVDLAYPDLKIAIRAR
jgi:Transcriptional regulator, AbiEi antitoxin